jgi:hypothetical protein
MGAAAIGEGFRKLLADGTEPAKAGGKAAQWGNAAEDPEGAWLKASRRASQSQGRDGRQQERARDPPSDAGCLQPRRGQPPCYTCS